MPKTKSSYNAPAEYFKLPISGDRFFEGGRRTREDNIIKSSNLPLVSVITVVLNGKGSIRRCINSVLTQSYKNIEYIIIDGGSTDGTLDILKEYDHQINYWVSEKDKGISDAFNKGISCATGDIIGIINADDWYESFACEKAVNTFCLDKRVCVTCGQVQYWKDTIPDYVFISEPSKLMREMTINHPSCFVHKRIYEAYGLFDCTYKTAMDYELMLRFYVNGAVFVKIDSVLANMQLDGVSDRMWKKSFRESRQAKIDLTGKQMSAYIYWLAQILRRYSRDVLLNVGLGILVKVYRSHLSIMKKHATSKK